MSKNAVTAAVVAVVVCCGCPAAAVVVAVVGFGVVTVTGCSVAKAAVQQ